MEHLCSAMMNGYRLSGRQALAHRGLFMQSSSRTKIGLQPQRPKTGPANCSMEANFYTEANFWMEANFGLEANFWPEANFWMEANFWPEANF